MVGKALELLDLGFLSISPVRCVRTELAEDGTAEWVGEHGLGEQIAEAGVEFMADGVKPHVILIVGSPGLNGNCRSTSTTERSSS